MNRKKNQRQNTEQRMQSAPMKEGEEEYRFLREVIKKKPIDKRKLLWILAGVLVGAFLFGTVSAYTFAKMLPHFQPKEEASKLDFTDPSLEPTAGAGLKGEEGSSPSPGGEADASAQTTTQPSGEAAGQNDSSEHPESDQTDKTAGSGTEGEESEGAAGEETDPDPGEETEKNTGEDTEKETGSDTGKDAGNGTENGTGNGTGKEEEEKEPFAMTLEDLQNVYRQVVEVAKEPGRAIVTVRGITNDVDWMNNTYENERQISGFLAADNGQDYFVVTEYQVVADVDRILVTFANGTTVDAHFQKQDPGTGLAVLKIDREEVDKETKEAIAVAELGSSSSIQLGDPVLAVGSPAGYSGSISYGMITSVSNMKTTVDNEYHLLITDITGDSAGSGVLVSMNGKIVGIIAQSFSMDDDRDVVTALPISELRSAIERLSNNEALAYLGIRGQDIASDLSQKTGIPKGVYVNAVEQDSPSMAAGIQNGDVIVKIGEESVETLSQLRRHLDKYEAEQKTTVTAMRKGAEGYVEIVFDVTVGAL